MGRYKLKLYLYTSFQKYHDRRGEREREKKKGSASEVAFPLRPNGPFQCCSVLLFKCKEMPCFSVPRFQAVKTTTAQSYLSHSLSLFEKQEVVQEEQRHLSNYVKTGPGGLDLGVIPCELSPLQPNQKPKIRQ